MASISQHAVTIAAYLGGVATILVLKAIRPEMRVVVVPSANLLRQPSAKQQGTPQPSQLQLEPEPETCRKDDDCGSPTALCTILYGTCEELRNPTCTCSQPQVLRCSDTTNRTKHTFCPGGCEETGTGARCV